MNTDDDQSKARSVQLAKKGEGWREREESKNASVTPRKPTKREDLLLVRC